MKIHQFHSGTAIGDAITNQMLLLKNVINGRGYKSEIYAEYIANGLENEIFHINDLVVDENDILIIHHSMGINCFDKICSLKCKKILIYHNITPEKYFDDEGIVKYIRIGLDQVEKYKDIVDYCITDSNYNRRELIRMGYASNIDVMPVQISLDRFGNIISNLNIKRSYSNSTNILFVGRVVQNKKQLDVIKVFAAYNKYFNKNSKLFIVGDDSNKGYVERLHQAIQGYELANSVLITGKVDEAELKAYYEIADVFLCMSEHEGFGVPLLEAMKMRVPVVAYRSSAIAETMGGAGIVITEKNYGLIASLIDELMIDKTLYNSILKRQDRRVYALENTDTEKILFNAIENVLNKNRKRTIQIQGPFETSYSLAKVNRKLAIALEENTDNDITIYCTEGPGDYIPAEYNLIDKPKSKSFWEKSKDVVYPDITIRNMYPPRAHDVNGGLNFYAFGWEESVIPKEYIDSFNKNLSGVGTMSNYVTEKLIECGLKIPVKTMGIGVELCKDFCRIRPFKLETKKKIKFLHISSAFPRKGVDVLLEGYYKAFTKNDNVCLVLKTFPNPHNNVSDIIKNLNKNYDNPPEIEWIDRDLSEEDLYGLYKASNCYVSVARGEGFGLPVAEAMLVKIPVIVAANSGMADFCNKDTALLVDFKMVPADTHITNKNSKNISMWFEPDIDSLVKQFRNFYTNCGSKEIEYMVLNAESLIKKEFSWSAVAKKWECFINEVEIAQYKPKVAMVTTWNNKCGIAEYSKMQVMASDDKVEYQIYPNRNVELINKDEEFVCERTWINVFEGDMDELAEKLVNSPNDIVHFQFNYGFFKLEELSKTIDKLLCRKKIIIEFHSTDDADILGNRISLMAIKDNLNKCDAIVVHQGRDVDNLISFGVHKHLIKKIALGQVVQPETITEIMKERINLNSNLVIGSYGFCLPHKGIKEVINAMPEILKKYPDAVYMPVCALYDCAESKYYYDECVKLTKDLNITNHVKFINDFLPNDVSLQYLQACDIMCMAYKLTQESASGAIRFCLATYRPIITTAQPIFDEFKDFTFQIKSANSKLIAEAIIEIIEDNLDKEYIQKEKQYISDNSWYEVAKRYHNLYCEVLSK